MGKVFLLIAMFSGQPSQMGIYNQLEECQAAAKDYTQAYCRSEDAHKPIYGSCWGCMHGCTREANIKICGTDPQPMD